MDILDKLFSRELHRRAGARAIKIQNDQKKARKRHKSRGGKVLSSAPKKEERGSLFHRLDIRFPWLKIVAICGIFLLLILNLTGAIIPKTGDIEKRLKKAPMSRHVKVTERTLVGKKLVALTFDDGPSSITTPRLLDILKEKNTRVTFFMLGSMARNNPEVVKRVENEGHEVASHTMYHQNLVRISANAAITDINEARTVFKDILGHDVKFTRPPYGNFNKVVQDHVKTPLILWSVDPWDWKNKNTAEILKIIKQQVSDGGIILMHDIYNSTVDATVSVIDELRKDGYEFTTISELAEMKKVKLVEGTAYRKF